MGEASTLQDFPLRASIQAVKASADFESYGDFYRYLLDNLPQNSPETRRRYAELVGRRYFPGLSLDNLLTHVWKVYRNERILVDLMRVAALEAEPVIAQFVLDQVWPLATGQVFDASVARAFINVRSPLAIHARYGLVALPGPERAQCGVPYPVSG